MADNDLKLLQKAVREELKPLHGEISRVTTELRGIKLQIMKVEVETNKNSREVTRLGSEMEDTKEWLVNEVRTINVKLDNISDQKLNKRVTIIEKHLSLSPQN